MHVLQKNNTADVTRCNRLKSSVAIFSQQEEAFFVFLISPNKSCIHSTAEMEIGVSYRLNKLKLFLFLHFLDFENIFQGGVIENLSFLIYLGVCL